MKILHGIDDVELSKKGLNFINLEMTKLCNLQCMYCFEDSGEADLDELSLEEKQSVLIQAKELGAKSLIISGAGEPLLDPDFKTTIKYAYALGMTSVIYTNGTLIDSDMVNLFYTHDCTPILKLDSLKSKIHDTLTGVSGTHAKAMNAIKLLLAKGFGSSGLGDECMTKIATATLYLKQNLQEISSIIEWAEDKGIKPTVDFLGVHGRAKRNESILKPTLDEIFSVQQLGRGESVCQFQEPCKLWKYGILISNKGYAKYCSEIATEKIGNIREYSLSELLERKIRLFPAKAGSYTCPLKEKAYLLK